MTMTRVVVAHGQGTCITPKTIEVAIVWENETDVWYRVDGSTRINQTSRDRFYSIVEQKGELHVKT